MNKTKTSNFLLYNGIKDIADFIDVMVELYTCPDCVLTKTSIEELIDTVDVDPSTEEGYNTIISLLEERSGGGERWIDYSLNLLES